MADHVNVIHSIVYRICGGNSDESRCRDFFNRLPYLFRIHLNFSCSSLVLSVSFTYCADLLILAISLWICHDSCSVFFFLSVRFSLSGFFQSHKRQNSHCLRSPLVQVRRIPVYMDRSLVLFNQFMKEMRSASVRVARLVVIAHDSNMILGICKGNDPE